MLTGRLEHLNRINAPMSFVYRKPQKLLISVEAQLSKAPLPWERGWGEGSGEAYCGGNSTLRPYPHPALRATFSRREKDHLS